jgi:hypothetical protein
MRKMILVLVVVGFLGLCMADLADAAQTADITVTVTCRMLSVGVSPTSYAFGTVNEGSNTLATSSITVTNNGNATETYQIKLTAVAGWTAIQTGTPTTDQYMLSAIFHDTGTAPIVGDFADNDALSTTYATSSVTVFAQDVTPPQTGVSVAAAATRNLWFKFYAPSATTVGTQQSITVTINATAS